MGLRRRLIYRHGVALQPMFWAASVGAWSCGGAQRARRVASVETARAAPARRSHPLTAVTG